MAKVPRDKLGRPHRKGEAYQPIGMLYHDRVCPKCGGTPTPEGHDPCIANLPGVMAACCGHGIRYGYIYFENGTILDIKLIKVRELGK